MSTILFIRHGESQSNVALPTTQPQSVELTACGIAQAKCIAHFLVSHDPPDLIVTSSYLRTKQTAAPTMARLPHIPTEEWPVHEFTYLSSEEFPAPSTIQDRRPLVDIYWELCDPKLIDGPGSESFIQLIDRARGVIKRLKETTYETIAIFSHEQFIRSLIWLAQTDPPTLDAKTMRTFRDALTSGPLPNGAILRTHFNNNQEPWQCELLDPHLLQAAPAGH